MKFLKSFRLVKKQTRKRSVSFAKPKVHSISPIGDLEEDADNLWYRKRDMQIIEKENRNLVELMKKNVPTKAIEKTGHSTRGLESHLSHNKLTAYRRRVASRNVVFDHQDIESMTGNKSPERLESLYANSNISSVQSALAIAKQDAEQVEVMKREELVSETLLEMMTKQSPKTVTHSRNVPRVPRMKMERTRT